MDFMQGEREESSLILVHVDIKFARHKVLKTLFFSPIHDFGTCVKKLGGHNCMGLCRSLFAFDCLCSISLCLLCHSWTYKRGIRVWGSNRYDPVKSSRSL